MLWLKSLFSELGYMVSGSPILWCDNTAAKSMSENPVFHSLTKCFEIEIHFVQEKVDIRYVPSEYQTTDILTKGCQ